MAVTLLLVSYAVHIGFPLVREALAIGLGALIVHFTGVLDDLLDLPPLAKLAAQALAVAVAMSQGILIERFGLPGAPGIELGFFSIPLTAFFLLGFINSVNLIDGLDGLATGVVGVGAFALAVTGVLAGNFVLTGTSLILCGSVAGFLPWNLRSRRKTFLGDAGSMLLGYALAVTAIAGTRFSGDPRALWVVVAAAIFPILDTTTTIARRARGGHGLFRPDAMHIHHRLIRFGMSPRRTVGTILLLTLGAAGVAVASTVDGASAWLTVSLLAVALAFFGVARTHRAAETDLESDASFREVVSYLLGAQDGRTARLRGDLTLAELVVAQDPKPATTPLPATEPAVTATGAKIIPLRLPATETPAALPIEEVPVK